MPDTENLPVAASLISVLMPVHETPAAFLEAAIGSVFAQTSAAWELCLADDASMASQVRTILDSVASDARVRLVRLPVRGGVSAATNAALALATGDFVAFMDDDDLLAAHALARVQREIADHPHADIVFTDEDQIVAGQARAPYFKPGWDRELMLGQNMMGHLAVYRRSLVEGMGGLRPRFDGSQDYDLALRAMDLAREVRHVPEVLYHWRQRPGSLSATRAQACRVAARQAVAEHLGRLAEVRADTALPQWNRVVHRVRVPAPSISLILPEGAGAPEHSSGAEVLHGAPAGAAARATGEVLVFLTGGLAARDDDWLRELVSQALRAGIGCVGGRIDDKTGRAAETGLVLDHRTITASPCSGGDAGDPGYRGRLALPHGVSAVSGDCLAIGRGLFEEAGGIDARAGAWWAVDLCLRVGRLGRRCLWTPHARLACGRRPAVAHDAAGADFMRRRWGEALGADPFLNPNLRLSRGQLLLASGKARS